MSESSQVLSMPELGVPFVAPRLLGLERPATRHSHSEAQLVGVIKGSALLRWEASAGRFGGAAGSEWLEAGEVFLMPPAHRHSFGRAARRPQEPVMVLDVRVAAAGTFADAALVRAMRRLWSQPVHRPGGAAITEALEQVRSAATASTAVAGPTVLSAVWGLLAAMTAATPVLAPDAPDGATDRRLAMAEQLMRDRLARPLDVDALAQAANVSRSQLTRLYAKHLGTSPAARLRQLRIEHAAALLAGSTLSVKEVAYACGFACPNHFSRVFRSITGRSPTQQT